MPDNDKITLSEIGQQIKEAEDHATILRLISANFVYDRSDQNVLWPTERIKVSLDKVDLSNRADVEILSQYDWLCNIIKNHRRRRFRDLINDNRYDGPHIVEEGDSWHLFPLIIDDIIDHLLFTNVNPLAIYSFSCAGDTLDDMYKSRKREYWDYIWRNRPDVMLLSGGANDLLGARCRSCLGNLYNHLERYQKGMDVDDLIKPSLHGEIAMITNLMGAILAELRRDFSFVKILVHGYDYPWPDNDKWLGQPMKERDIPDDLQRPVIMRLLKLYNEALEKVIKQNSNAHYVDLLDTLKTKDDWFDELHPTTAGFKKLAAKVRAAI